MQPEVPEDALTFMVSYANQPTQVDSVQYYKQTNKQPKNKYLSKSRPGEPVSTVSEQECKGFQ